MKTKPAHSLLQCFATRQSGSTAIEFAILAPVYLLMLTGIIGYGIYFGASHSIQQLAADAARASVAGIDEADRREIANVYIADNATGYYFVDPARLDIRLDIRLEQRTNEQFDVELRYDASALPIWSLYGGLAMPDQIIFRRSTIRVGGI